MAGGDETAAECARRALAAMDDDGLLEMARSTGHAASRHLGRSAAQLVDRTLDERFERLSGAAGAFADEASMIAGIRRALERDLAGAVAEARQSTSGRALRVSTVRLPASEGPIGCVTYLSERRDSLHEVPTNACTVVFSADADGPTGIRTAYPALERGRSDEELSTWPAPVDARGVRETRAWKSADLPERLHLASMVAGRRDGLSFDVDVATGRTGWVRSRIQGSPCDLLVGDGLAAIAPRSGGARPQAISPSMAARIAERKRSFAAALDRVTRACDDDEVPARGTWLDLARMARARLERRSDAAEPPGARTIEDDARERAGTLER